MSETIINFFLPASLFIIMFGMGLGLTVQDFRNVTKMPKAVAVGIACQMIGLPILAYFTVKIFNLQPELAIGLMILSFCPGGVVSNIYSYLAKADLGLSISLTAITGLLSPFTVPLFGNFIIKHLSVGTENFSLPVIKTMLTLIGIIIVPVLIGMYVRSKKPEFAKKAEKPVRIFSSASLLIIILAILIQVGAEVPTYLRLAGPASISLNILSMTLGVLVAFALKLPRRQAITIGLEIGLQNAATGMLITTTILKNTTMAIPPSTYGFLMFFTAALFVSVMNKIYSVATSS